MTDYVGMAKERTTLAEAAKPKLKDELSSSRAEFESYCCESKKKFHHMSASYSEFKTRFARSEKKRAQYYVKNFICLLA